jgi:hypothetical protein
LLSIVLFFTTNFQSCKKNSLSEEDAIKLQQQTLVDYTVTLVSADKAHLISNQKSASAMNGAAVKVTQGDQTITKTADASGIVVFTNLKLGTANVNIKSSGYSEINYVVDLLAMELAYSSTHTSDETQSSGYYHYSTTDTNTANLTTVVGGSRLGNIIAMIPNSGGSMATIQGKVTFESDLTNSAPENAPANTSVIAILDGYDSNIVGNQMSSYIQSMSYDSLDMRAVTDANGNYSIKVPATADGLSYQLVVPDFSANQQVIMWTMNGDTVNTAQTIPTYFGTSFTTPSTVPATKQVNITISAPGYSYTQATANAVLDNINGIENIQLISNGAYYTAHGTDSYSLNVDTPRIAISTFNNTTGKATASIAVNSDGRIIKISMSSKGSKYLSTAENADFSILYIQKACRTTIASISSGDITFTVNDGGLFMTTSPDALEFYSISGLGSGAVFTPTYSWNGSFYALTSVTAKGGTGYTVGDVIGIRVKSAAVASQVIAKLHMTKSYVSAVNITSEGVNYKDGKVLVEFVGGGGTEAAATATVTADGRISGVDMTNDGKGYTSVPTVNILNTVNNVNATATATVNTDGVITSVTLKKAGSGYYTVPTVTVTPSVSGIGSGAILKATVAGGVVSGISIVTGGSGYKAKNIPAISVAPSGKGVGSNNNLNVQQNGSILSDIYLGTGKRTIEQ